MVLSFGMPPLQISIAHSVCPPAKVSGPNEQTTKPLTHQQKHIAQQTKGFSFSCTGCADFFWGLLRFAPRPGNPVSVTRLTGPNEETIETTTTTTTTTTTQRVAGLFIQASRSVVLYTSSPEGCLSVCPPSKVSGPNENNNNNNNNNNNQKGSQYPAQVAVFVHLGQFCSLLGAKTYTGVHAPAVW